MPDQNPSYWSEINTKDKIPSWFPMPVDAWCRARQRLDIYKLAPSNTTPYSWVPSYTDLLTGTGAGIETRRIISAMIRDVWWWRAEIARKDPSVCPLSKKEFRAITSGAEFRKNWPPDNRIEWQASFFWMWGLRSLWGQVQTDQQQAITRLEQDDDESSIEVRLLPAICCWPPNFLEEENWTTDHELITALAVYYAENQFLYQLMLLDPDLNSPVHSTDNPQCRHPKTAPICPYLQDYTPAVMAKLNLVNKILWMDGLSSVRGWEREDIGGRRKWVALLSSYLTPLWFQDEQFKNYRNLDGRGWADVVPDAIMALNDLEMVKGFECTLLEYWMTALAAHHSIVAVPLFPSNDLRAGLKCGSCRAKDLGAMSPGHSVADLSSLTSLPSEMDSESE